MFAEVAPGVFSAEHQVAEGKNAVLFGARGALAIDAGMYLEEGLAMAAFIRDRGWEPERFALTHGHGDHVLGASPLAGGEVYAHALTPKVIRRQVPGWAAKWGKSEAEVEAELIWPTVTFSEELCVDMGGRTVRFFPTPGHSEDSVSAFVEEERVLIGGDAVVTGIVPAIGDGDGATLEASLRRLAEMEIEVLVAGHGPVLYGAERIRDWLEWEADYLGGVRQRVEQMLVGGADENAAADAVDFGEFVGERLPEDRHGMPKRHRATVAKIVAEERAKREKA
jgi:cyclase